MHENPLFSPKNNNSNAKNQESQNQDKKGPNSIVLYFPNLLLMFLPGPKNMKIQILEYPRY